MTYFTTGAQLQAAINDLPASKKGSFTAFDGFFYGEKYMAAYSGSLTPLEHFVQIGADRGYAPSATFDPAFYASAYSDLKGKGLNSADLLYHFLQYGLDEGRAPNATLAGFNATQYLANNTDVASAIAQAIAADPSAFGGSASNGALAHYVKFGQAENRTDVDTSAPGAGIKLTAGQDNVTGTAGNDIFTARIFDNQNTLQSGDAINGGAGNDTLVADIGSSQAFAITPELTSVETVKIRVQAEQRDSGDNNIAGVGIIDAERSVGVTHWESNNSRADLVVEDVRIAASQITKDITIAMVETDPGHVDFAVYFDQYSLRAQTNTSSTLTLQLMDTRSNAAGSAPLKDSPYEGFAFNLTAPGASTPKLVTVKSEKIDAAQTYQELVDAINEAIAAMPELSAFTAKLGGSFTVSDTLGSRQTGTEIVLTATDGSTVSAEGVGTGWIANGAVPPSSGLHTFISTAQSNTTDLVTSKIILDDVGRGSTGGDLVVGGLSVGDTSGSLGVQRFEIEVRDNSKLQTINSTNNTLREVTLKNGVTTSNSFAYQETVKDAGNLTVNGTVGEAGGINAPLPGSAAQHNVFGFSDVKLIDGSAMTGKLAFTAEITQASIAKYLNLKDVNASPAADNVNFVYNGGANDDTINVVADSQVLASRTLTGREDFKLNVNGGAGNDTITVDIGSVSNVENGEWRMDQFALKNVVIDGGAGNDTINAVGTGYFNIEAGAGNDTVYVDNTGAKAQWVVAAANTQVSNLQSAANAVVAPSFMYKGKVTVAFSAGAQAGLTAAVADALNNGFEATVDLDTAENYAVTQYHVNQAIKKAINSDPVLSKLLAAVDGPGTSLVITSLIDGSVVAGDLQISVKGTDLAALPASEQASVLESFKLFSGNSAATLADANAAETATAVAANAVTGVGATVIGTNDMGGAIAGSGSTAHNDSIINAGAGDDVVVLSTGAFSNNVVKFTGYDQGLTTIVNFNNDGSSADRLDFSSYLVNKSSASGSTLSQALIAPTLNADATVEANSITVLNLVANPAVAANNFANLTAEKFLAAINSTNTGTGDYANINAGTLNALNTYTASGPGTTLVGGIGKAVVLVHNEANDGQYKAFEVTFNGTAAGNTTADFSSVTLIGTFDLGETLVNPAAALLTNVQNAAEGGAGPVIPPPAGAVVVAPGAVNIAADPAVADVFSVDVAALLADVAGTNTQTTITGFDVAMDSLRIDLPLANAAITTLAQLDGQQGVSVQVDPFANLTLINFGNDANGGEVVTITLAGVIDPATVHLTVI